MERFKQNTQNAKKPRKGVERRMGLRVGLSETDLFLVPPFTCTSAPVCMIHHIFTLIKWIAYHIYIMNHELQNTLLFYSLQKLTAGKRKSKLSWGLKQALEFFQLVSSY